MNEIIQLNSVDVYNKMYGLKTLHPHTFAQFLYSSWLQRVRVTFYPHHATGFSSKHSLYGCAFLFPL